MKKANNKIIAVVIVVTLIVSAFVVGSFADTNTTSIQVSISETELYAGDTATVTVSVTTNYPVATASIPVFYDKTLVSVSNVAATLTDYAVANTTTDATASDSGKIYANTNIDSSEFGFVLVNYIGEANAVIPATLETTVLTFTITALEDVTGEAVVKCVTESAKISENSAGMLYFGKSTSGTTITSIPENVEDINVESASATVNTLTRTYIKLKDSAPYKAVIDTNNKPDGYDGTIYGIDTLGWDDTLEADGKIADFLTTTYGDEYLEVVVGDAGVETTGTVINVLDEDGVAVETYVFIYFGDLDMDGAVGFSDASACDYYEMNYMGIDTLYQFMGGDVDSDTIPGFSDASTMDYWEMNYMGMPLQADVGAVASTISYEIF